MFLATRCAPVMVTHFGRPTAYSLNPVTCTVQRFCAKIDLRLYRPTYRYLRGNPHKQAQAKQELADLGKKRRPVNSSC